MKDIKEVLKLIFSIIKVFLTPSLIQLLILIPILLKMYCSFDVSKNVSIAMIVLLSICNIYIFITSFLITYRNKDINWVNNLFANKDEQKFWFIIWGYIVNLFIFATLYLYIYEMDKCAFNIPKQDEGMGIYNSIYFSIITSATVGYGDIYPLSPFARFVVSFQILSSLAYVVLVFVELPRRINSTEK